MNIAWPGLATPLLLTNGSRQIAHVFLELKLADGSPSSVISDKFFPCFAAGTCICIFSIQSEAVAVAVAVAGAGEESRNEEEEAEEEEKDAHGMRINFFSSFFSVDDDPPPPPISASGER